jgi:hypothetical protein
MAQYITKIRTESGDLQIDYNALANLPDIEAMNFAKGDHTHTPESLGASKAVHTHTQSDIIDFPTSLPANGGNADTVDDKHASDFAAAEDFNQLKSQVDGISLTLSGLNVNIEELNHMEGVTSNIQDQLDNKAESAHNHSASDIDNGTFDIDRLPVVSMEKGGTDASDGATGLQNLLAAGMTILSDYQYGDTLPEAGNKGRIFFKKVII